MGIKVYKMLNESFKANPPIVLTRNDPDKFIDNIYVFAVSDDKIDIDLFDTNFKRTNLFIPSSSIKKVDMSTDDDVLWPFFYIVFYFYKKTYWIYQNFLYKFLSWCWFYVNGNQRNY